MCASDFASQRHWCPQCPSSEMGRLKFIGVDEDGDLIFKCETHGVASHWSNEDDFCWCEK